MDLDPVSPLGVLLFVFLVAFTLHSWIDLTRNRNRNPEPVERLDTSVFGAQITCDRCGAGVEEIEIGPENAISDPCMARCSRCGFEWVFIAPFRGLI
jgi:hypothetical protein